ncbi:MAG TPA: RDD family protein, partial [Gaiellaceae bacterium]|nr:RDD family protein [Gaiellaceae bacterium]
ADAVRARTHHVDDRVESRIHRAIGLADGGTSGFGGLATRAVGLVVDSALALAAYLVAAGAVALVVSLAGSLRHGLLTGSLFGAGWMLVVAVYFVFFWSTAGQTPGMRLMGIRVVTGAGAAPSVLRSIVRFVGLVLAIALLFLGFLPVLFDRRRRALQDYLAGTAVVTSP